MSAGGAVWTMPRAVSATSARERLPWAVMLVLAYLGAITIFGKGPTYLGYPPLYWGELVMVAAVVWLVNERGLAKAFLPDSQPLTLLILGFMGLAAALVLRGLPQWGELAIRDAAMCYYAVFYFVGYELARKRELGDRVWRIFTGFWLLSMVWTMIDLSLPEEHRISRMGPMIPWRDISVFWSSHKELVQHMGLATILVFGRWYPQKWRRYHWLWAPAGVYALLLAAASQGRAEKLSIAAAWGIMLLFRFAPGRPPRASKAAFQAGFVGAIVVLAVVLLAPAVLKEAASAGNFDRFSEAAPGEVRGTSLWRLVWWKQLVKVTLREHPVWGLGYGTDLSYYNHYLRRLDEGAWPTRSPHNFNMTVFSRMGLLGLALWAAILLLGVGGLLWRAWRNRVGNRVLEPDERAELIFWAAMLAATWVNSSLGVLMEGPVLGIWFWFALGFGSARAFRAFAEPVESRALAGPYQPRNADRESTSPSQMHAGYSTAS